MAQGKAARWKDHRPIDMLAAVEKRFQAVEAQGWWRPSPSILEMAANASTAMAAKTIASTV